MEIQPVGEVAVRIPWYLNHIVCIRMPHKDVHIIGKETSHRAMWYVCVLMASNVRQMRTRFYSWYMASNAASVWT